ncbi:WYL domain-containing transcriptional regulator [Neobacillus mesonae]|nr:WYL domain-containing transcriptional regulator [Neobacillus mesonae]
MARESFDKEIQFLRLLALTGGAYSRQQFAERLGISVHTYDKTLRSIKERITALQPQLPKDQNNLLTEGLRYSYYENADPLLLFLFRGKSLKATESTRLSIILTELQHKHHTAKELVELCGDHLSETDALPDEKTIRGDLKYLEEVGVIRRTPGDRPVRYSAATDIIDHLSDDELLDLYDFVDVMANTQLPSVQGYILRDNLKKALRTRNLPVNATHTHVYKYHYPSRILDEAHLYGIFRAIQKRLKLRFLYLSPKKASRYAAKNTNPLFHKESRGLRETVLPLRVIYDHQYGRWYLIGHNARQGLMKFRIEGLTEMEEGDQVPEALFQEKLASMKMQMEKSWVTDTGNPVKVLVRFFNPEEGKTNFVLDRVLAQGQWGTVTEESEASFLYEITVNGTTEIKPWLRSFGSSCEVLAPRSLRNELAKEWKEILAYYEQEPI